MNLALGVALGNPALGLLFPDPYPSSYGSGYSRRRTYDPYRYETPEQRELRLARELAEAQAATARLAEREERLQKFLADPENMERVNARYQELYDAQLAREAEREAEEARKESMRFQRWEAAMAGQKSDRQVGAVFSLLLGVAGLGLSIGTSSIPGALLSIVVVGAVISITMMVTAVPSFGAFERDDDDDDDRYMYDMFENLSISKRDIALSMMMEKD